MGRPPLRVDVMMSIPGITFEEAWGNKEAVAIAGTSAFFMSREDLMRAKQATSRPQDLIDLENLKKNP